MSLVSEALKQLQNKQSGNSGFAERISAVAEPSAYYSAPSGPSRKVIIILALAAVMTTALLMSLGIFLALYLYFPATEQRSQPEPEVSELTTPETSIDTDLSPLLEPDIAVETSKAGITERYRVTMIMKGGSSAMAIVNGRTVEIGDRLSESSRIVDIQARHIVIQKNGERYRLTPESR